MESTRKHVKNIKEAYKKNQKKPTQGQQLMWMMWDGMDFFGFDHKKIPRLKGKDPRWWDKLTEWESAPIMYASIVFFAIIFWSEFHKVYHVDVKS